MSNADVQACGEEAAARFLRRRGLRILHRNWRVAFGELDLVAREGETLVFVEVKARQSTRVAEPFEGVGHAKQRRLRRLAEAYLVMERPAFRSCRFDVVSVVLERGRPRLEYLPGAF